jgi:hypothetical protein
MNRRMDAAGPVDAKNAPTGPWKTAKSAVSHSAHTHHLLLRKPEKTTTPHTEFLTLPTRRVARTIADEELLWCAAAACHR